MTLPTPPVPTERFIRLLALGAPLWLTLLASSAGWILPAVYLTVVLAMAAFEYRSIPGASALSAARRLPRFALGSVHDVVLAVENRSMADLEVVIRDELPAALELETPIAPALAPRRGALEVTYQVSAVRRGAHPFGDVVLRLGRPRGLLRREVRFKSGDTARIYPRFAGVTDYRLLAKLDHREHAVRRPRRVFGSGTDFESLSAYTSGEDPRRLDWKISAKRGFLVSRNLQTEKGQHIAVLLDAGRLMAERIAGVPRFEHALRAAVTLSYVAQKRGDALSAISFTNKIESFLPPTRGAALTPRLLESLYTVQTRPVESDYWRAMAEALTMMKRRSLMIVMTDVLDPASSAGLARNLARAAARHLVLCVVLTEPRVGAMAATIPGDLESTYRKAAACHLRLQRQLALEQMRSQGVLILQSEAETLSIEVVRRYLEIRKADLQ